MSADEERLDQAPPPDLRLAQEARLHQAWNPPTGWRYFSEVNNSAVGMWYTALTVAFLVFGGVLALLMRIQLASLVSGSGPRSSFVSSSLLPAGSQSSVRCRAFGYGFSRVMSRTKAKTVPVGCRPAMMIRRIRCRRLALFDKPVANHGF